MFHDTGDNNILTVANRINFSLNTLKVLIYKDRMILSISVDDVHELLYLFIGKSYLHALSELWDLGTVLTVAAWNMDYSSPAEIEEKIDNATRFGLRLAASF